MKKNITKIIFSITMLISASAGAQVANYVFTQASGTYAAISGGTVLGNTTIDNEHFLDPALLQGDYGLTGPGFSFGFTFTFNGVPYDRLGVDPHGWVAFGQSSLTPAVDITTSNNDNVILGFSTIPGNQQQRVAALSRDLAAQPGSELRIQTLGSTPNQTCVIQWTSFKKAINGNGDDYSFQIRLLETSNIVEVIYGKFVNNTVLSIGSQVGLRGTTNTDYNARVVNNNNLWTNSIAGATNAAMANHHFSITPPNGLTYRWYPPVACTTIAANSAITQQTLVCPFTGSSNVTPAYSYTNTGFTYQWYSSSVSASGPYTSVSGATLSTMLADTLPSQTWYQAVITCTNSANTITSNPVGIQIAGTTTNSVPYYEGFESIVKHNDLPNCSWIANSQGNACLTYTSPLGSSNRVPHNGSKYAAFSSVFNASGNYFYSNGIQLEPGITYSAGVYYITDGTASWPGLSLMLGTSQSASSMTNLAAANPATGQVYQLLSNTFTVATSGIYYLGVRAVSNSGAAYLSFDDLFITIPCSLNSPSLTISGTAFTICSGVLTTLAASGANSYNWVGNGPGNPIVVTPQVNTTYSVIGTSSLTGCQTTNTVNVVVNPKPTVSIFSPNTNVCSGSTVALYGTGDGQLSWSNGSTTSSIVVSPQVNTTYTLSVSGIGSCTNSTVKTITVNIPAPVFAQISPGNAICVGETAQLIGSGTGVVNFEWNSNDVTIQTKVAMVSPLISTAYTLTGTDANGCTSTQTVQLLVNPCTGIAENTENSNLLVYPNPTSGQLIISTGNVLLKNIVVTDISGRLITTMSSNAEAVELSLDGFAKGIYYAKITTNKESNVVKIVKE